MPLELPATCSNGAQAHSSVFSTRTTLVNLRSRTSHAANYVISSGILTILSLGQTAPRMHNAGQGGDVSPTFQHGPDPDCTSLRMSHLHEEENLPFMAVKVSFLEEGACVGEGAF